MIAVMVHCNECAIRRTDECPMYFESWETIDEGYGYKESELLIRDNTEEDGFCHKATPNDEEDDW